MAEEQQDTAAPETPDTATPEPPDTAAPETPDTYAPDSPQPKKPYVHRSPLAQMFRAGGSGLIGVATTGAVIAVGIVATGGATLPMLAVLAAGAAAGGVAARMAWKAGTNATGEEHDVKPDHLRHPLEPTREQEQELAQQQQRERADLAARESGQQQEAPAAAEEVETSPEEKPLATIKLPKALGGKEIAITKKSVATAAIFGTLAAAGAPGLIAIGVAYVAHRDHLAIGGRDIGGLSGSLAELAEKAIPLAKDFIRDPQGTLKDIISNLREGSQSEQPQQAAAHGQELDYKQKEAATPAQEKAQEADKTPEKPEVAAAVKQGAPEEKHTADASGRRPKIVKLACMAGGAIGMAVLAAPVAFGAATAVAAAGAIIGAGAIGIVGGLIASKAINIALDRREEAHHEPETPQQTQAQAQGKGQARGQQHEQQQGQGRLQEAAYNVGHAVGRIGHEVGELAHRVQEYEQEHHISDKVKAAAQRVIREGARALGNLKVSDDTNVTPPAQAPKDVEKGKGSGKDGGASRG